MKKEVAKKKDVQQTQGVEILQQTEDIEAIAKVYTQLLVSYTQKTDVPILEEFCIKNGVFIDFILSLKRTNLNMEFALQMMENKKHATLERMIFSGELNATIGAHLLKTWREEKPPERDPHTHRPITPLDFDDLGFSREHCDLVHEALLRLSTKKKMSVELKL